MRPFEIWNALHSLHASNASLDDVQKRVPGSRFLFRAPEAKLEMAACYFEWNVPPVH